MECEERPTPRTRPTRRLPCRRATRSRVVNATYLHSASCSGGEHRLVLRWRAACCPDHGIPRGPRPHLRAMPTEPAQGARAPGGAASLVGIVTTARTANVPVSCRAASAWRRALATRPNTEPSSRARALRDARHVERTRARVTECHGQLLRLHHLGKIASQLSVK